MSTFENPPSLMVLPQSPRSSTRWPQPPMPLNMNGDQSYASEARIARMQRKKPKFAWMAVCGGAQRRREDEQFERQLAHQEQVMAMQHAGYAAGSGFAQAGQLANSGMVAAGSDIRSGMAGAGMDVREGIVAAGEHLKGGLQYIGEKMGGGLSSAGTEVRTGLESAGKGVETAGTQVQVGIHRAGTSVEQGVKKHGDTIYDGMIAISKTCIWIATSILIIAVGYTSMWMFISYHKDAESVELGSFSFRWSVGLCTAALCIRCVAAVADDHRWITAAVCTLGWAGISLVLSGFLVAYYIATRVKIDIHDVRGTLEVMAENKRLQAAWSNACSAVFAGLITSLVFCVVPGILAILFMAGAALVEIIINFCSYSWWRRCCIVSWLTLKCTCSVLFACLVGMIVRVIWLGSRVADCVLYALQGFFGFLCACMDEITRPKPRRRPSKQPREMPQPRAEKKLEEPLLSGAAPTGTT
mmetsp:Transcript_124747/g.233317  ORF Transcript_124747/g.233317 Transcript_124747/m.233317 type:complete len:470 (-) Transcript_124747:68-1477(-)